MANTLQTCFDHGPHEAVEAAPAPPNPDEKNCER